MADQKGFKPFGDKEDKNYPRKWKDDNNQERLRLDEGHKTKEGEPYKNPNAARDHVHGYDKDGNPLTDEDGDKHFPTRDNNTGEDSETNME